MNNFIETCGKICVVMLGVCALLVIPWIIQGQDFFLFKFFAPKYELVRRETFERSKAYNQGMIQELEHMRFDYVKADEKHKTALSSIILHRASDYDESKMPSELRQFIGQLRRERTFTAEKETHD